MSKPMTSQPRGVVAKAFASTLEQISTLPVAERIAALEKHARIFADTIDVLCPQSNETPAAQAVCDLPTMGAEAC